VLRALKSVRWTKIVVPNPSMDWISNQPMPLAPTGKQHGQRHIMCYKNACFIVFQRADPWHPSQSLASQPLWRCAQPKCANSTQNPSIPSSTNRFKRHILYICEACFIPSFLPNAHAWHPSQKAAWCPNVLSCLAYMLPSRLLPHPPHPSLIPVPATWHLLRPREPFLSSIPGSKEARPPEKPGVSTCFA
jgi:hypothetical protein